MSVYRTIGPLDLIFDPKHMLWVPTINVLSKIIKNIKNFLIKFSIFSGDKNLSILLVQVLVMIVSLS